MELSDKRLKSLIQSGSRFMSARGCVYDWVFNKTSVFFRVNDTCYIRKHTFIDKPKFLA